MTENPKEQVVSFEDPNVKVKATENTAEKIETKPIDRVDIEKRIARQEKEIDELCKAEQKLQNDIRATNDKWRTQLQQFEQAITAKRGAVAGLKDLLGQ